MFRRGHAEAWAFPLKHALVQDAMYGTIDVRRGHAVLDTCGRHREPSAGHDPIVCAIGTRARAEFCLGHPQRACELLDELESRLPQIDHLPTQLIARCNVAFASFMAGEPLQVRAIAAESAALCRRLSLQQYEGAFTVVAV